MHLAERPVGDDPGVVVDAAVALGLADHRDRPGRRRTRRRRSARPARWRRTRCAAGSCGPRSARARDSPFGSEARGGAGLRRLRAVTTVPAVPATASAIAVQRRDGGAPAARLDEPADRLDLRAHASRRRTAPAAGVLAQLGRRSPRSSGRCAGVPKPTTACSTSVAITSTSAPTVAAEQRRGQVLVDHGLDAAQRRRPASRTHRDPAATGRDHDEPGVQQRARPPAASSTSSGSGRGDHPAPAALAAVLPDLAVLDQRRGLVLRAGSGRSAWSGGEAPGRRRRPGSG